MQFSSFKLHQGAIFVLISSGGIVTIVLSPHCSTNVKKRRAAVLKVEKNDLIQTRDEKVFKQGNDCDCDPS